MITITDNYNKSKSQCGIDDDKWEVLKSISHCSIEQLSKENRNLLVFPHCIESNDKEFSSKSIIEIVGDNISTRNLVGFIGVTDKKSGKSVNLTIRSRFQNNAPEDYFLHYMLQKVFKVNILDLQHSGSNEDVFDFALYLFPHYLKRAMRQGLFKQYCKREYNDANVRGVIDVSRHIRTNIPFNGRIAYRTREYQYDNSLMQLIRHTIEYIRIHKWAGNILKCERDMCDSVRTIYDITPSYKANDRQRVIAQNIKPVTHPFYREYRVLQQLCLQILRCKGVKYGSSNDKIYGILFDCAWLWEEYLATIMPEGFTHAVRAKKNGYKFFNNDNSNQRYPDFYSIEEQVVLDAKYKHIDKYGIQRNDLFQLIAYMHTLPAEYGALIYPSDKTSISAPKTLAGKGGDIYTIGLEIPEDAENYNDFFNKMEKYKLTWNKDSQQIYATTN